MSRIKLSLTSLGLVFALVNFFSCQDCTPITISYQEEEPYIDYEEQKIRLTFKIQGDKIYWQRIPGAVLYGTSPRIAARCYVTNTSENDGYFKFYCTIISSDNEEVMLTKEQFIMAGRSVEMVAEREIPHYSFESGIDITDSGIEAPIITIKNAVERTRIIAKSRECKPCEEDCENYSNNL